MTTVSRLVLRDLVHTALTKQGRPITVDDITDALAGFLDARPIDVRRTLRQLEAQGLAARTTAGRPPSPRGGRPADLWHATP